MSKFDYSDPGTDPEYCNSLAPEIEDVHCGLCGTVCVDQVPASLGSFRTCDACHARLMRREAQRMAAGAA